MEKNWLIRTKSNHILGPVSKEKVLELYHNGSIKPDDEVCSGNGYWFFVREDDLVNRFLLGSEVQGFNPISEAKDVLTASHEGNVPPSVKEDITLVGSLNLSVLNSPSPMESNEDVPEIPASTGTAPSAPKETSTAENKKKTDLASKPKTSVKRQEKPLKKQDWLKYVGILGFLFLLLLVYFRKTIIQHVFHGEISSVTLNLINAAHAQEDVPEKKKSS